MSKKEITTHVTLAGGSIGMDGHASFRKDTNISLPYLYMLQYSHLEY
jgi:hypothetical protein